MTNRKKIFIIAGEASGDILGASLARELLNSDCVIEGIGGEMMVKSGCKIAFHYENIAVMGLFEVIPALFRIRKYMQIAKKSIVQFQPDVVVTIDSPGFNFRLIKSLKNKLKFTAIHYVAPTVWAYAENRVKIVESLYDHLLLILPFEGKYFNNMRHTFVGHPIIEDSSCLLQQTQDIKAIDIKKMQNPIWNISIMVGSRAGEIKRHIQIIIAWIELMRREYSHEIHFHFLTLPHIAGLLYEKIKQNTRNLDNIYINSDISSHNEIIQKSILGIVKSGTATTRFMANATPAITFYKVSNITAWIMRFRLKINKFNLCNIITDSNTLPELMQGNFTANNLLDKTRELLTTSRQDIMNCYLKTWNMLKQNELPGKKAAEIVKKYL
jgi:lipid-A-disaccharide synthase